MTYYNEEKEDATRAYDSHLLMGHFIELDTPPLEDIEKNISEGESLVLKSKVEKGEAKLNTLVNSLRSYAKALALKDKCLIDDIEGLFSFICTRHPDAELDWSMLQRIIYVADGKKIDFQDQKTTEIAITIYISSIKNELNRIK